MLIYEKHLFGDITPYGAWQVTGYRFPLHFHRSFEIANMLEGKVILQIDGKDYEVNEGDTIVIFPNQLHSITAFGDNKAVLLQFSPDMIGEFTQEYKNLVPENNLMKNTSLPVPSVFSRNRFVQKGILYQLMGALSNSTGFVKARIHGNYKVLHQLLSYIETHYMESCSLQAASLELGYDYSYLSRTFRKITNFTYTQYLNNCRIGHAVDLLSTKDIPVSEVAWKCGFKDPRNFNRLFKSLMGITPRQYRQKMKHGH